MASEFLSSAAALAAALAPSGRLRAAINLGNPVLAQRSGDTLTGVTVDLATALAKQLGVPVELLPYPSGGAVVRALGEDNWDVGFLAAEPERAEAINFTTPYVFIEGTYLVDSASPASSARDLDKVGARIAVGDGAAYHHILARQLQHAELCLAPTSAGAIDLFLTDRLDAAAGVRQTLKAASAQFAGTRVLEDSFSRIEQAIAVPKAKPSGTFEYVQSFLDARVQEGFVERALHRSGQGSASSATHGAGQS